MLDNTPNQPTKFRTKNWVEINDESRETYNDGQYIHVVMLMYDLIEYSDNYSKTSAILWQCYRDALAVDNDGAITEFTEANVTTDLFSLKEKL